ncbi:hypothetical protein [Microcystis sp. M162S2]|nr:hypothetical protein [Microcystis sp. M162S2]
MLIFNSKAAVERRGFRPKISDEHDAREPPLIAVFHFQGVLDAPSLHRVC